MSNHLLPLPPPPLEDEILNYLEEQLPGYPFDQQLDQAFVQELLDDFPNLDVLEEIKRFRWYYDNQPPLRRPRATIRRWIARALP
jgi:hypothetical protein